MFQFRRFAALAGGLSPRGLSHSDTLGSMLVRSSPRLFAAVHVLRRLSTPRHPPCALSSFAVSLRHVPNSRTALDSRIALRSLDFAILDRTYFLLCPSRLSSIVKEQR